MTPTALGLITGLVIGLALAIGGWWAAFFTFVFAMAGIVVGKILQGDIDPSTLNSGSRPRALR